MSAVHPGAAPPRSRRCGRRWSVARLPREPGSPRARVGAPRQRVGQRLRRECSANGHAQLVGARSASLDPSQTVSIDGTPLSIWMVAFWGRAFGLTQLLCGCPMHVLR
jgi:hypothetical protein